MSEWQDMLGIPYEDAPCRTVSAWALKRLGFELPGEDLWFSSAPEMEAVWDYFKREGHRWQFIGIWPTSSLAIGDVVLVINAQSRPESVQMAVVIDVQNGRAITSLRELGTCILRIGNIPGEKGIWRMQPC